MNMKRVPKVVGFMGVKGSGKDHRAGKLASSGKCVVVDFKDELLDFASDVVGYDVREDYDWFKEAPLGMRRPRNKFIEQFVREQVKELRARGADLLTGRKFLQRFGTDAMRKRDRNYWVRKWRGRAKGAMLQGFGVACADCRFDNEARTILRMGGRLELCDFRSKRYDADDTHESERLAQALLALGYRDGDAIGREALDRAREHMRGG